ncbi:MAG TPA: hypothetical protein VE053_08235 [Allosphingosinicella sp.]|nr:hypothetical protein [Allosphingosinicella sp.]
MTALHHPLTWASPRPLWRGAASPGRAPTLLRFASDEFMEQLIGLLAADPGRLATHVARYETWRTPPGKLATADLVERVPLPAPMKKARLLSRLAKGPQPVPVSPEPEKMLKLYQPAHQRYYVVAGTLACAIPGLPDRRLGGGHEQVGFVVRRLLPASKTADANAPRVEYAFVKDGDGARWQRVSGEGPAGLAPGEDRLPLFPLAHEESNGIRRTMWGGLVPVGRREEYASAKVVRTAQRFTAGQAAALATAAAPAPRNSKLARSTEFKLDFADAWKALIQSALKVAADINGDRDDTSSTASRQEQLRKRNLQYQMQSWLLLADLLAYLDRHLKPVLAAVRAVSPAGLSPNRVKLYDWLSKALPAADCINLERGFEPSGIAAASRLPHVGSVAEALRRLDKSGRLDALESNEHEYANTLADRANWPEFHFLLAGIACTASGEGISAGGAFRLLPPADGTGALDEEMQGLALTLSKPADPASIWFAHVDKLTTLVALALDANDESEARPLPFAQQLSQTLQDTVGDSGFYRIRFVHLNEDCGPLHPPTLSEPTETFELASFFDSDAPARPIRISLPLDTSAAGLRKHSRGTAFVLSNMLCGQVQRAKGLGLIDLIRHVLPWPLHKELDLGDGGGCKDGGVDIGMICSLSIPIVTICALILLLIIVTLLDFIFRWLPWLIFCFPVPKLRGKKP